MPDFDLVHSDCAHYRGSAPCRPHKERGRRCADCPEYEPLREAIIIVKLGAIGDVLRTTALLPDIAAVHDRPHVTWVTRPESVELLRDNPAIASVVATTDAWPKLAAREFDCAYILDSDEEAAGYSASLRAKTVRGFRHGPYGRIVGVWPGGDDKLYRIGLWDDLKRQNRESYLRLLARTAGLRYGGGSPFVAIHADEARAARAIRAELPETVIGINTDAGARWLRKRWNLPYVEAAVAELVRRGHGLLLFGGASLTAFNDALAARYPGSVRSYHSAHSFASLAAGIAQVDVLLTGDTLAMHVAWAVGTPIVALFGPTSLPEADLAADDVKLADEELNCLACYLHTCSVDPHCMDRLTPSKVIEALARRLADRQLLPAPQGR